MLFPTISKSQATQSKEKDTAKLLQTFFKQSSSRITYYGEEKSSTWGSSPLSILFWTTPFSERHPALLSFWGKTYLSLSWPSCTRNMVREHQTPKTFYRKKLIKIVSGDWRLQNINTAQKNSRLSVIINKVFWYFVVLLYGCWHTAKFQY